MPPFSWQNAQAVCAFCKKRDYRHSGQTDILLSVYMIAGFFSAVAGLLLSAQLSTVHPTQGNNYQLDCIAACILGGTSLMGGEVNIVCCVAGAIIIKCIESCINILNLNYYMYQAILGVVILAALVVDGLKNRMK